MSDDDVVSFAIANMELEGLHVDDHLRVLMGNVARGYMTVEEALKLRRTYLVRSEKEYLDREKEDEKKLEEKAKDKWKK